MARPRKYKTKKELDDWYWNWLQADLSYLLRPHGQTRFHRFCDKALDGSGSPVVGECHRRMGKSFDLIVRAVQCCLRTPGAIARIGAPTEKQALEIIATDMPDLLDECPQRFRPRTVGSKYYWRNPRWEEDARDSVLHIVGCDYKRGELLRGAGANFVGLDEAGWIRDLEYIRRSVIAPQFDRTDNPEFIIVSTPPPSGDHYFVSPGGLVEEAIGSQRFIKIPGSSNPDFNEREKRKFLEAAGINEDSVEYLREIECCHISDVTRMVVPEFPEHKEAICQAWRRPRYFIPWMIMDTGWTDHTAVLYCYPDFEKQLLIVEDMTWRHYSTLGVLEKIIRQKMQELYTDAPPVFGQPMIEMVRQVADCTELDLQTLNLDHGFWWQAVEKYGREAAIAELRTAVQNERIRIHPRNCEPLIYQLENALWNESRTHFQRSRRLGHCDALMALVYAWRMIIMAENPYPDRTYNTDREWVVDVPSGANQQVSEGILRAFGLKENWN